MAMNMTSNELLSLTQKFLSPDSIQKFSQSVGQSTDKTKSGLRSIIPTLLGGIVDKGSTPEGAASIMDMANKKDFAPTPLPQESQLSDGNEVVQNIFGSNLNATLARLGNKTGLNPSVVNKLMGLVAPAFMGVIGSKIKNEKLSASGLMSFLSQQKTAISALGAGSGLASGLGQIGTRVRTVNWARWALAALVLLGLLFWWFARQNKTITTTAPVTTAAPIESVVSSATSVTAAASLNDLESFLQSANASDLPKRFRFDTLRFSSGATALMEGSVAELDKIAAAMLAHPKAQAQVQGFTDNVGNVEANRTLSAGRAQAVKEQLVAKGIEESRIKAVGFGSESPIGDNTTSEGRALNRRIEFVITHLQ